MKTGVNLETGETFLSMTSTAGAVGRPASSTSEFLASKQPEAAPFKGSKLRKMLQGRTTYTLVPTAIAAAYFTYWARKGNKDAIALVQAIIQADMDRSIKEANGVTVAAAEHEANRVAIRHHLVQARVDINAEWESECARISKAAAKVTSAEAYERLIQPQWDRLRNKRRQIEAVQLTEEEYALYVDIETDRRKVG